MARSVTPSLTSRFTQLIGAPGDAAHQALLDDLARQPTLASALLQVALGAPAEARARGLALLHPYLTSAEERNRAEFAISQLPAEHRAVAYGLMAAAAADAATHRRWFEAELAAINELTSDVKRIAALERAAEHTPGALWDGLLAAAGAIRNEARRGKAFHQLLPRVPERLLPAVMRAMLAARRPEVYVDALAALVAVVSDRTLPTLRQRIEHFPEDRRAEAVAALTRREVVGRSWQGPMRMPFEQEPGNREQVSASRPRSVATRAAHDGAGPAE